MRERVVELIAWSSALWLQRLVLTGLLVSNALMGLGTAWDIHWHAAVGRDSTWIPPHMMVYSGVVVATVLGVFAALLAGAEGAGYRAVAVGGAVMVCAAVFDAIWHRVVGDQTIWSPPHTLGAAGAITITAGSIVVYLRAGRRLVLAPPWARAGTVGFFASLCIAAFFGLLPATVMAFLPQARRLPFVFTTSPYVVAGLAALTVPAIMACSRVVLGQRGLETAVLVGVGFWCFQEVFHLAMTPLVAGVFGYDANPHALPNFRFRIVTLGYMVLPLLVVSAVALRRARGRGAWQDGLGLRVASVRDGSLLGALYTAGVVLWLAATGVEYGLSVPAVAIPVLVGAASAAAGLRGGQWIQETSCADGSRTG